MQWKFHDQLLVAVMTDTEAIFLQLEKNTGLIPCEYEKTRDKLSKESISVHFNRRKTASVSLITTTGNCSWHFQCVRGLKFKRKNTIYDNTSSLRV